ncbi:MAG: hypothetical protein QOG44_1593, partial [Acidimicrobiaceae bacterium]|nr:hypothetical protein [Acidimicrobiaceae bacterium]
LVGAVAVPQDPPGSGDAAVTGGAQAAGAR